MAAGAKKPKLGSGENSSPATGKHTDPHGHITDTRELEAAEYDVSILLVLSKNSCPTVYAGASS